MHNVYSQQIMLRHEIEPRSSETNATGHIDHTVIPIWFEMARTPLYRIFNPTMSFATCNTVIRKIDIEFVSQTFHDRKTEVRNWTGDIGNTSFLVEQELWQEQRMTARGRAVIVHFDYAKLEKTAIPEPIRERLRAWQRNKA